MKILLALVLIFSPLFSFALSAPHGDPWFISTIVIDKNTLPAGVTVKQGTTTALYINEVPGKINTVPLISNSTSIPLLIVIEYPKAFEDANLINKPYSLPPEMKNINYALSTSTARTIIKLQNNRQDEWEYLQKEHPDATGNYGLVPSNVYYEWGWDSVLHPSFPVGYFPITEDLIRSFGYKSTWVSPGGGPPGENVALSYTGYKRPDNVVIPQSQSFSFPVFYGNKKINITGKISYALTPNYTPPDWEWNTNANNVNGASISLMKFGAGMVLALVVGLYIKKRRNA